MICILETNSANSINMHCVWWGVIDEVFCVKLPLKSV